MDDQQVRKTLEAMGGEAPTPPRTEFADELEAGLLAGPPPAEAGHEAAAGPGWLRPAMLAAAAVLLVAVLFVGLRDGPPAEALTVASATDAVVELPDGRVADLRPGDTVVDGSVIRTGRDGSAEVDGIVLGPDEVARVTDGEVDVITDRVPATDGVRPADGVRPTDGPPATDGVRPTDGPRPTDVPRPTDGTSDVSRPIDDQRGTVDHPAPAPPASNTSPPDYDRSPDDATDRARD